MKIKRLGWIVLVGVSLIASHNLAAVNDATQVLGFEQKSDWSTTTAGAVLSLSSTHTQGSSSLAVNPSSSNGWTPLFSVPLSNLSPLSGTIALDIMLPTQQANPYWYGAVQVYLNCPSRNIYSAYLAEVELTGLPLAKWQTLTFPVTSTLVNTLLPSGYSDLTFEVVLNVAVPTSGTYLIDNLRFVPATNCAGQPNGVSCSDGNLCTLNDVCENGTCIGLTSLVCNDNNPCTVDSCNPATGCQYTPVSCGTRTGQILAPTFDSSSQTVASSSTVTPSAPGAWLLFKNVDFGTPANVGRFEVDLFGASANSTIELHLGSPTGQLLAALTTFKSDPINPVPQAVDFVSQVSGVQTVAIVFDSTATGSLGWFELLPAEGQGSVSNFPATYQHPTLSLPPEPPQPGNDTQEDVPPVQYSDNMPISVAPNSVVSTPVTLLTQSVAVVGQLKFGGPSGNVQIWVVSNDPSAIADGGTVVYATGKVTPLPSGWEADVATAPLPPLSKVAVLVYNPGSTVLSGVLNVGGVQ